ncbi:RE1-silencing transcription factor-like 2 [Homarus americanus]|uniref:RE1-silencing transcription factor-like 2 n=1 Tax=Homarus americanus TaxID=6706 RepID=A0A8J5T2X1_HOMAM|nr:RE1-silencing transcription factor-like 2 [Homarus americanus]
MFKRKVWVDNDSLMDDEGSMAAKVDLIGSRKMTKMYQCTQCSYKTSNRCDITKHYSTHTGVKPFSCLHCSYQTADKSNLTKHSRIHTGEKPYFCPCCPYRATRSDSVKSHFANVHKFT